METLTGLFICTEILVNATMVQVWSIALCIVGERRHSVLQLCIPILGRLYTIFVYFNKREMLRRSCVIWIHVDTHYIPYIPTISCHCNENSGREG